MRKFMIYKRSTDYDLRLSPPPWRQNPWLKPPTVDRGAAGALQATVMAELPLAQPIAQQRATADKQQQKTALSAWEDEGGSTESSRKLSL